MSCPAVRTNQGRILRCEKPWGHDEDGIFYPASRHRFGLREGEEIVDYLVSENAPPSTDAEDA